MPFHCPPYHGSPLEQRPRRAVVVWVLVASLVAYAAIAITRRWWPSVITAPIVAVLLWRRHPRARFAAYIFFTVLAFNLLGDGLRDLFDVRTAESSW